MENIFFDSTEQIIRIENPVGVDSAVDYLQTILGNLTYTDTKTNQDVLLFEKILPLAELSEDKQDRTQNNVPAFRIRGERYSTMIPERVRSYCFFRLHSDVIINEGSDQHEYDMSLICWGNHNKIQPNRFGLHEWFIGVLERYFFAKYRNNGLLTITRIYRDKAEVWEGMNSVEFMPNDNPYFSFRMRFLFTFTPACPVDLVVDSSLCI